MSDTLERLKSALTGRYAVERELGAGGMAVVYLARDLKHDRRVALKVLRPEVASSVGHDRFLREIQVAAKLSHPHILPLYDSGEADGFLFFVMPYVEGESLHDRLERERQLPVDEAVRIALEVTDALGYAHEHGLVHRDIKPGNIMLSGGHALVMDFGICRALDTAGGERLTKTATSMGTPTYMAPEQWDEAREVDGRADLYSLGCTLYEMLVGQPPFTGKTLAAIMARHSMEAVPKPSIQRDAIHPFLESVTLKALSKSPADRYASAAVFAKELERSTRVALGIEASPVVGGRSTLGARRPRRVLMGAAAAAVVGALGLWIGTDASIAGILGLDGLGSPALAERGSVGMGGLRAQRIIVLFFDDVTPDGSLEYLADGLTEALIGELALVPSLDVVSSNGSLQFRGSDLPYDSVAEVVRAGTVVSGTVGAAGDRVRVNVVLADGQSGTEFRRGSFERPSGDLFGIQSELAQEVALLLREWLGEEVRLRSLTRGTESVEAWQLVQRAARARKEAEARIDEGDPALASRELETADSLLALAEAVDPGWAEPAALRALVAYARSLLTESREELRERAEDGMQHANQALSLERDYAAALETRGMLRYWSWLNQLESDPVAQAALLQGARQDLERAVEVDPDRARAHATLSLVYYEPGIEDAALAAIAARRAYEVDAFLRDADLILQRLFITNLNLQQFSQARRWCDEGQRRFPDDVGFVTCDLWLMLAPASDPTGDEVWAVVDRAEEAATGVDRELTILQARMMAGAVLAKAGLADSARSVIEGAHEEYMGLDDPTREVLGMEALAWINLGELDHAIDLLKLYVVTHHGFGYGDLAWWWQPLRDHPRFGEIVTGQSP